MDRLPQLHFTRPCIMPHELMPVKKKHETALGQHASSSSKCNLAFTVRSHSQQWHISHIWVPEHTSLAHANSDLGENWEAFLTPSMSKVTSGPVAPCRTGRIGVLPFRTTSETSLARSVEFASDNEVGQPDWGHAKGWETKANAVFTSDYLSLSRASTAPKIGLQGSKLSPQSLLKCLFPYPWFDSYPYYPYHHL